MSPAATPKATDREEASAEPPVECRPLAPPGMFTVTCEAGMSGEARSNVSVVGFVCTHLPETLGVTVGAAFLSATGAENVSEMVVFDATFCVPAAGVADVR